MLTYDDVRISRHFARMITRRIGAMGRAQREDLILDFLKNGTWYRDSAEGEDEWAVVYRLAADYDVDEPLWMMHLVVKPRSLHLKTVYPVGKLNKLHELKKTSEPHELNEVLAQYDFG